MIRLSEQALEACRIYGRERERLGQSTGRRHGHGLPESHGLHAHVEGVTAEMAGWLFLDKPYWVPVYYGVGPETIRYDMLGPDGTEYDIKGVRGASRGLIAHPDDPDDQVFVLVDMTHWPVFTFPGWLTAGEIKRPEFWRAEWRSPTYCAPREALRSWPQEAAA